MAAQNVPYMNGAGAANGAGMQGVAWPQPGHNSDMVQLLQNFDTLGERLRQNREDFRTLQDVMDRVQLQQGQARHSQGQAHVDAHAHSNGVDGEHEVDQSLPFVQRQLREANQRAKSLVSHAEALEETQKLYENAFARTTQMIHDYAYQQSSYITQVHRHYNELLQQSRQETIQAQIYHQEWQASLQRVSEGVRGAMKKSEEQDRPWKRRVAGLRRENALLRKQSGWEPLPPDSDSEQEEDLGIPTGIPDARGRMIQGQSVDDSSADRAIGTVT